VRQALEALNRFVSGFPKSEYVPKARALIADSRELLASHERYVAEFYWKREQWRGAAGRYMALADTFGDLHGGKVHGESLWRAAQAYGNAKDLGDQRKVLQRLVQEAPQDPRRAEAEAMLKKIPADAPVTSPTDPKPQLHTPSDPAARKPVPEKPPPEAPADQ
jgi:outer membrane protein assembly factor BamD